MLLKNWCSIHARWTKSSLKHFIRFCGIFPSLKQNFIAYRSSKLSSCPDCIFEIHQLWQSGFRRVYSNSCCNCSFKREIIKIGQLSHKVYSNNIVYFQESTTILNAHTKKVWKLIVCTSYILRVKWSNPGRVLAPSSTPQCSSYWKGSLLVTLDCSRQLTYLLLLNTTLKFYNPKYEFIAVQKQVNTSSKFYIVGIFSNQTWFFSFYYKVSVVQWIIPKIVYKK